MTEVAGQSLLRRQGGQALVLVLLTFAVLIGFAALVVNVGHLVIAKVRLQSAADLTAFSAATVQAAAMNEIVRHNKDMYNLVKRWRKKEHHFHSDSDAKRAIREAVDENLQTCGEGINVNAGNRALAIAAKVGDHNYPGAEVSQVGMQKVLWVGRWEPHPIVAKMTKGSTSVSFRYWVDTGKLLKKETYTYKNPYVTLETTAMFWARLRAALPATPWPLEGFKDYLPTLTAESMAQPYNGHLGRTSGMADLDEARDAYEVKFTRINHERLTTYSPNNYFVYAATPSRGLTGEIVSESTRRSYAH